MLSNIIVLIGIASNGNDNILVDKTRVAYILITRIWERNDTPTEIT